MSDIAAQQLASPGSVNREVPSHLHALLSRLGEQGKSSGAAYERLRRSLILMLRRHVPVEAEDLADVALERLARRIHEGAPIDNPQLYALGIARKLVMEAQASAQKAQRIVEDPTLFPREVGRHEEDAEGSPMLAAVSACLAALDESGRQLLLSYYGADGSLRIRTRQDIAQKLGISVNALRNRALRLRQALEECARNRLNGAAGAA